MMCREATRETPTTPDATETTDNHKLLSYSKIAARDLVSVHALDKTPDFHISPYKNIHVLLVTLDGGGFLSPYTWFLCDENLTSYPHNRRCIILDPLSFPQVLCNVFKVTGQIIGDRVSMWFMSKPPHLSLTQREWLFLLSETMSTKHVKQLQRYLITLMFILFTSVFV